MPFAAVWEGMLTEVVEMPSSADPRVAVECVLRHQVAVVAQDGFGDRGEGLSRNQISECHVVLEHPHQADATNVITRLVLPHCRIRPFPFHRFAEGGDFVFAENGTQIIVSLIAQGLRYPSERDGIGWSACLYWG